MKRLSVIDAICLSLLAGGLAACNGSGGNPLPTQPLPQAPGPVQSSWIGDQTLVSCSGSCSLFNVGETFSRIRWGVTPSGSSIDLYNLDADMAYRGTLDGRLFVATYPVVAWEFPENSRIEGEFAPDLNSFEALETHLTSGPAGETRVIYHWRVSRNG